MNSININIDMSSADFLLIVVITWGKKAIVVKAAAINPYSSGNASFSRNTEVIFIKEQNITEVNRGVYLDLDWYLDRKISYKYRIYLFIFR